MLRLVFAAVTVDLSSFAALARAKGEGRRTVLCPTHRSLLDFVLLSFLAFAVPEADIEVPWIVADEQFKKVRTGDEELSDDVFDSASVSNVTVVAFSSQMPVLGRFCTGSGAVYIKRKEGLAGCERAAEEVAAGDRPVEVFLEGTRSRDRRWVKPKVGFLRSLLEKTGGVLDLVPVCISYERVPEQRTLAGERYNSGLEIKVRECKDYFLVT